MTHNILSFFPRGLFTLLGVCLLTVIVPQYAFGEELINLKLESTRRGYDTVTAPPSGVKQDFSIPKAGIMTVIHTLEPYA